MRAAKLFLLSIFVLAATVSLCAAELRVAELALGGYQSTDGAMVLNLGGDYVEPYFATKALLAAQDGGLDIRSAALAWIHWALPRQEHDGRFVRFCRKPGTEWKACGAADADDSMLALWIQLLHRMAPESGLPQEWQQSSQKAWNQLKRLRNSRLHVYHVSRNNHVALLMDNLEVYAALKDVAQAQERFGDRKVAAATEKQADDLAGGINRVFWDSHRRYFHASMQKNQPAFYPDGVAQVFPMLTGFAFPRESWQSAWSRWKSQFARGWISDKYDPHPWGLIALAALKMHDENTVGCWLSHSEPLRHSQRWNVLEEAVFQALYQSQHPSETKTSQSAADPRACMSMGQP